MRKLLSLILSITMLLGIIGTGTIVFAGNPGFEAYFNFPQVKQGYTGTFYVDFSIKDVNFTGGQNISGLDAVIGYPPDKLTRVDFQQVAPLTAGLGWNTVKSSHDDGTVFVVQSYTPRITADATLFRIGFQLKPGVQAGEELQFTFDPTPYDDGFSDKDVMDFPTGWVDIPKLEGSKLVIATPDPPPPPAKTTLDDINDNLGDNVAIKDILDDTQNRTDLGLINPTDIWNGLNEVEKEYISEKISDGSDGLGADWATSGDIATLVDSIINKFETAQSDLLGLINTAAQSIDPQGNVFGVLDGTNAVLNITNAEVLGVPGKYWSDPGSQVTIVDAVVASAPYATIQDLLDMIAGVVYDLAHSAWDDKVVLRVDQGAAKDITALTVGESYQLKVFLRNISQVSAVALPFVFDNSQIKINALNTPYAGKNLEGVVVGNSNYETNDEMKKYDAYSAAATDGLVAVNADEKFVLSFVNKDTGTSAFFGIGDIGTQENDNLYFVIEFTVLEDATAGSGISFDAYNAANGIYIDSTIGILGRGILSGTDDTYGAYALIDSDHDSAVYKPVDLSIAALALKGTTKVKDNTIQVAIIDKTTKKDPAIDPGFYKNDGTSMTIELDSVITYVSGFGTPDQGATWEIVGSAGDAQITSNPDGSATLDPGTYYGDITIRATSAEDPTKSATTTFEIADLVITAPADPTTINLNTTPSATIIWDLKGNAATIAAGVTWGIYKNDSLTPLLISDANVIFNAATGVFAPTEIGKYKFVATSVAHTDLTDSVTIIVTAKTTIMGKAMLSGKQRSALTAVGYAPGTAQGEFDPLAMDAGIKVELLEINPTTKAVIKTVATTHTIQADMSKATDLSTIYNYSLEVDGAIANDFKNSTAALPKYALRFTRYGDNNGTVRQESYLCAEQYIDGSGIIGSAAKEYKLRYRVYLEAGAFVLGGPDKTAITAADLNTLKSQVGNSDATTVTTIYNVNEYLGVDSADYSTILKSVGRTKNAGTVNLITGAVTK